MRYRAFCNASTAAVGAVVFVAAHQSFLRGIVAKIHGSGRIPTFGANVQAALWPQASLTGFPPPISSNHAAKNNGFFKSAREHGAVHVEPI